MTHPLKDVDTIIDDYRGLSRKVLEYSQLMKKLVNDAKQPGFSADSLAPLAELIDTEAFDRTGNFKEVMTWQEYADFLVKWAATAEWECSFKRISERPDGVVMLELEERTKTGDYSNAVNSLSVYEFNDAGKIRHIDIYLQMELPPLEMLKSYEGLNISQ